MGKEELREYTIKFKVDTLQTEETVKSYSRPDAISLIEKKYANCKIRITDKPPVCDKQESNNYHQEEEL